MAEKIDLAEAEHEVRLASRRIALLHLAYARAIVEALGEKEGRALILRAIKGYGTLIGEEVKAKVMALGLPLTPENYGAGDSRSLPRFGMHERVEEVKVGGELRLRVYGCVLAQVWREHGEEQLGRLYCYVDPVKYMTYNPAYKLAHAKAIPDGDPYCEFCIKRTQEWERGVLSSSGEEWVRVDAC